MSKGFRRAATRCPMRPKPTMPHPLVLQVVGAGGHLADVPAATQHFLVCGHVVADQRQYLHNHVLGDADDVATGYLRDGDAAFRRRGEIEVIRTDAGGEKELEVGSVLNALAANIGRPEGGGDEHVGGGEMAVQACPRVGGRHQLMTGALEPFTEPQGVLGASQQFRCLRRCISPWV